MRRVDEDGRSIVTRVLAALDSSALRWSEIHKNGRLLLALPGDRTAALRALALYQPQRLPAKVLVAVVRGMVSAGLLRLLPAARSRGGRLSQAVEGVHPGTVGVLLGSPEHRVRRAIASYRSPGGWEVAKIGFGGDGRAALEREMKVLSRLTGGFAGVPAPLGQVCDDGMFVLRLPRIEGATLGAADWKGAVELLEKWMLPEDPAALGSFGEWKSIRAGLRRADACSDLEGRLENVLLRPVVRHGDFARWNLIRTHEEGLVALDWEWASARGMPGIDLAHFFAQEARLVKRLNDSDVVESTLTALRAAPCADYLRLVGWQDDAEGAMLASIAYTCGAGQQDNLGVLAALAARMEGKGGVR